MDFLQSGAVCSGGSWHRHSWLHKTPPSWTEAIISVIPKPGRDEEYCGNYRPIYIFSDVARLDYLIPIQVSGTLNRTLTSGSHSCASSVGPTMWKDPGKFTPGKVVISSSCVTEQLSMERTRPRLRGRIWTSWNKERDFPLFHSLISFLFHFTMFTAEERSATIGQRHWTL